MDQALRDTIQYHVGEGFELETLTADNRATLVRDGEVLRLRMEGASVFLRHETQPATGTRPAGRSWLAIALLALALIAALALLIFLVLPQLRAQPAGIDSETAAPAATAVATTAPAVTATANAPPDARDATPIVPPPIPTLLSVSDQRFAPGTTTVSIGGVSYHTPFFVVAHEGDADRFGDGIAHSDLLPAGMHERVKVTLPRPLRDGEYVWLMLHGDTNGNGVYDGAAVDGAISDAAAGNSSFASVVVFRIQVTQATPTPPASGNGGLKATPDPRRR